MSQHVHLHAHSSRYQHAFLMIHTSLHSQFHPLRAHYRKLDRNRCWDRRDTQTHRVPEVPGWGRRCVHPPLDLLRHSPAPLSPSGVKTH